MTVPEVPVGFVQVDLGRVTDRIDADGFHAWTVDLRHAPGRSVVLGRDGDLAHPWTPELGRVLYAVDDGDAVSVRQHLLDD